MRAIIFDLDGVLTSTDEYHYQSWKSLTDRLGIYFDRDINNSIRGLSRMASLNVILEKSDKKFTEQQKETFAEEKNQKFKELLSTMTPDDMSGDKEWILEELRGRGYLLAIGSSSKNARMIIDRIGLGGFFDVVLDGNDVIISKPDPEIFVKAAAKLGCKPEECLVVEDAVSGAEAAHGAGIKCVCVGDASAQKAGDYNLDGLSQILSLCPVVDDDVN